MKAERREVNGSGLALDVGLAIDEGEWTVFEKTILCLASIAFIVDGLANQVMSISIPAMMSDWHVSRAAFAPVVAMGWVGVAVGTILAGTLADRFGRKTMLLVSVLLFGAATGAIALATDIHWLLLLRTIDGLGIGGAIPTATTLIAEVTPSRRRSRAVNIGMISIPLGNFLCGMIGSVILPHFGWRTLFLANGAISILVCLVLLVALPESPRFLACRPRRRDELLRGLAKMKIDVPAGAHFVDGSKPRQGSTLSALFGGGALMATLGIWGAFFFCFLAVYSSLNWMPSLLSSHGYGLSVTSLTLSVSGIGGMAGSVIMASLVETFGSRIALGIATSGAALGAVALSQLPLDPAQSVIPLMAAVAVVSMCLNALTGCIYALAAFVYPPFVKGTGLGAAGAVGRIGAITSSYAAVAMLAIGSQMFFDFIAASALISMGFLMTIKKHIPKDKTFAAAVNGKAGKLQDLSRKFPGVGS